MRQTSIDVYHKIKASGILSKRKWEMYDVLYASDYPMTANECCSELEVKLGGQLVNKPSYTPTFAPMERTGCIEAVGQRKCMISGETCTTWQVTGAFPLKVGKKISENTKLKARIVELEAEVKRLGGQPRRVRYSKREDHPLQMPLFPENGR